MKLEEIIRSNPNLKSLKKIDLLDVSSINCSGSFDVEYIQSDVETGFALALSDNDAILNNIEFVSTGDELHINNTGNISIITNHGATVICSNNFRGNISGGNIHISGGNIQINNRNQINDFNQLVGEVKIFVVLPKLNYLKLSGAVRFLSHDLKEDYMELRLSGTGAINLSGKVKNVDAKLSGTGTINLENLICDVATLKLSGVGLIKSHVSESVTAKVSGVGDIKIYGNPIQRNVSKSGLGKIEFK